MFSFIYVSSISKYSIAVFIIVLLKKNDFLQTSVIDDIFRLTSEMCLITLHASHTIPHCSRTIQSSYTRINCLARCTHFTDSRQKKISIASQHQRQCGPFGTTLKERSAIIIIIIIIIDAYMRAVSRK